MFEYEEEDDFHRDQVQKNRQALIFVFLLMVTMVLLGDQHDEGTNNGRNRRQQYRRPMGSSGFVNPNMSFDLAVPLLQDQFAKTKSLYSFRTVMPPAAWVSVENQYGDDRVVTHNTTDRPLVMVTSLRDLYQCDIHRQTDEINENATSRCNLVSGIPTTSVRFANPPMSSFDDYYLDPTAEGCAQSCQTGSSCSQIKKKSDDEVKAIGKATCLPTSLSNTHINVDNGILFYHAVPPRDQFEISMKSSADCMKKRVEMAELLEQQEVDEYGQNSHFKHHRTPLMFNEMGGGSLNTTSTSDGSFYPVCAVKIGIEKQSEDSEIEYSIACRTYNAFRGVANPFMIIPFEEHYVVLGLNGFGSLTVIGFQNSIISEEFEEAYSGKFDTRRPDEFQMDPICEPPSTGPRQRFISSFTGFRSGYFFPPNVEENGPYQLLLAGDGGQWYSSRIIMDLERGIYSEDPIYMGLKRF